MFCCLIHAATLASPQVARPNSLAREPWLLSSCPGEHGLFEPWELGGGCLEQDGAAGNSSACWGCRSPGRRGCGPGRG